MNVTTGEVSHCVLSLDQGMILAAIANALADDAMRQAFADGPIEATIRPLIAPEEFTAGADSRAGPDGESRWARARRSTLPVREGLRPSPSKFTPRTRASASSAKWNRPKVRSLVGSMGLS